MLINYQDFFSIPRHCYLTGVCYDENDTACRFLKRGKRGERCQLFGATIKNQIKCKECAELCQKY